MPHHHLDSNEIVETVRVLRNRIDERFPGASLVSTCEELLKLARDTSEGAAKVGRPIVPIRLATGVLLLLIAAGLGTVGYQFSSPDEAITLPYFVQLLEAAINDVVFIGLGVFFLFSAERKLKRNKVLKAMHKLRSIAHIVDMLQLTKDPGTVVGTAANTRSSPLRDLTRGDLARYLDYCSEMLSLIGKLATVYAQYFDDMAALASVREVEELTTGLSSKMWQKLMVLELSGVARGYEASNPSHPTQQS